MSLISILYQSPFFFFDISQFPPCFVKHTVVWKDKNLRLKKTGAWFGTNKTELWFGTVLRQEYGNFYDVGIPQLGTSMLSGIWTC